MGNHQSAEAPRRLTKPRTNTSTTNLLAGASVSRRNSTLEPPVATKKRASLIARVDITETAVVLDALGEGKAVDRPQRWSLFRSKSAVAESTAEKIDSVEEARDTDASHPLQRYSSVSSLQVDMPEESRNGRGSIRPPVRNTRSAISQNPRSQHAARLSLVVEVQTPEPVLPDESRQLGFKVTPSDDVQTEDSTSTPIERPSSNHSPTTMGIPIRRRSLLTPGVATRCCSNDNMYRSSLNPPPFSTLTSPGWAVTAPDHRRSLPLRNTLSFDYIRPSYHDESDFTSSPFEEVVALQRPQEVDPQPRVSTPSDLDYRHIGAFKLGSLRITNGSASPVPSVQERIFWDSSPSKTNGEGSRLPQHGSPSRKRESWHVRADGKWQGAPVNARNDDLNPHHVTNEPSNILRTTVEIPGFSLVRDLESSIRSTRQLEAGTPKSAHEIARAYMQDIASSPFSFDETPLPSPQLEATSKHTAIEDNLFDDDIDDMSLRSLCPLEDVSRQSSQSTADQPCTEQFGVPHGRVRNLQANHLQTMQGARELAPKPLEKADSGYSSKTSLRSFGSRVSGTEKETPYDEQRAPAVPSRGPPAPPVPGKSPPPPPPKTAYLRNSSEAIIPPSTVQGVQSTNRDDLSIGPSNPQIVPTKPPQAYASGYSGVINALHGNSTRPHQAQNHPFDGLRLNPYRGGSPMPQGRPSLPKSQQSEPPPLPIKSIEENQAAARIAVNEAEVFKSKPPRRQSAPNPVPRSSNSLSSKPSESDISTPSIKRKLQKPRYAQEPEVVIQGFTDIDTRTVPPVSQDAADRLEERLKSFPTLSHTYKSVHKTNSKETLATILPAGSLEVRAENRMTSSRLEGRLSILSTASSNEDIEQFVSTALLRQPLAPAKTISAASTLTKSRRKSAGGLFQTHDFDGSPSATELDAKDFDSVSDSMVASSLEYPAMNSLDNGSYGSRCSLTSHDTNGSNAGSGRTVGMDSRSAAQLARDRSRFLRRHSSEEWASSTDQQLPSASQSQNSIVEDAPPVPNLLSQGVQEKPRLQKMKSSPPVSMKMQLTQSTPRPPPSTKLPATSLFDNKQHHSSHVEWSETPIPNGSQWQDQTSHWRERRKDLGFVQRPAEQGYSKSSILRSAGSRGSFDQLQPQSQPSGNRPSFKRQGQSTSEPVLKKPVRKLPPSAHQNPSFQNQRSAIARQLYDPLPPRRDRDASHRSSVDPITGSGWNGGSRPGLAVSNDPPPTVPITVDRYNGGYGYGFEGGLGVGGSAGLRHEGTAASRKGVEGSLLWGVDFSDVPIMVMQRPRGLGV